MRIDDYGRELEINAVLMQRTGRSEEESGY